jgi:hypothetical protein
MIVWLITLATPVSHHLGPIKGWRCKRLDIAVALRKQGWTYAKIADYLFSTPKTIMRDIKCFAIKSHCSEKYKFHSKYGGLRSLIDWFCHQYESF